MKVSIKNIEKYTVPTALILSCYNLIFGGALMFNYTTFLLKRHLTVWQGLFSPTRVPYPYFLGFAALLLGCFLLAAYLNMTVTDNLSKKIKPAWWLAILLWLGKLLFNWYGFIRSISIWIIFWVILAGFAIGMLSIFNLL